MIKKPVMKRGLAIILTLLMTMSVFLALPAQALADSVVNVGLPNQDRQYYQGDAAVPITVTFEFQLNENGTPGEDGTTGAINSEAPITVQWFKNSNESTSGATAIGPEVEVPWYEYISTQFSFDYTPSTDTPGLAYYFARLTYNGREDDDGEVMYDVYVYGDITRIEVLVRDEYDYYFEFPFTKIVEQGGSIRPEAKTFTILGIPGWAHEGIIEGAYCGEDSVDTDGVGSYSSVYELYVTDREVMSMLMENGLYFMEDIPGSYEYGTTVNGWEYSDALYFVRFEWPEGVNNPIGHIYEVIDYIDGSFVYSETEVDVMEFTNVYTMNAPILIVPVTPKTGDLGVVALSLAVLSTVIGVYMVVESKKQRQTI